MIRKQLVTPLALGLMSYLLPGARAARAQQALTPELHQFVAVDSGVVALRNVKVIDGTGAPARDAQTIVLQGGRIAAAGPLRQVRIPAGARVLELPGHTVIPGLVGLHNHTFYTAAGGRAAQLSFSAPRLYLAAGVTTIRTTGARAPYEELNLRREIEAGRAIGPTIFVTGPYLTGQQGSMTMARLGDVEDARRVARYWAEEGVSWLKAYTWISRDELAAAIEEARRHGVKVTAHLCSVTFREAVALGIDNLEHGLFANTDYYEGKPPDACPPDYLERLANLDVGSDAVRATIREMVERGVAMTSTLAVYEIYVPGRPAVPESHFDVLAPEVAAAVRAEMERYRSAAPGSNVGIPLEVYRKASEFERAFFEAGGLLAAGVDPTGYGAAPPGLGDQRNYELLLEAGFSPVEVIRIMSANGARVLGIADSVGRIAPGMVADLVVLEGDPERDRHIRTVKIVFRRGVGWDSRKLLESVRGLVGIR
jgi:imidazolonepropionase-like amidohydrolase